MMRALVFVLVWALAALPLAAVPASYDRAIANVLKSEGGYTNDRADPGGPTNWGITIYDARKYWRPGATAADVRAMPLSVAKQIYRDRYWAAVRADELCAGLDYTVFDYAVNSGVGRAGKVLRRVTRQPTTDWHVTDEVITATRRDGPFALPCSELIEDINAERLRFLKSLHTWPTFGHGWGRRVASVRAISLAMAGAGPQGLLPFDLKPAYGPGKAYAAPDDEGNPEPSP